MQVSFDVAKGREVELWNRVNNSDPTNAVFVLVALANLGLESDETIGTHATLAAVLAGTSNEVTNTGYSRIVLDDTDIAAYTVDTTNHSITLPLADQTFPTVSAGDSWRKLLFCYDSDSTAVDDSAIIPVTAHDILVNGVAAVPNGNDIIIGFGNGVLIAS